MSSPVPEDGLTPEEAYQADYVIRGASNGAFLAQAAALGGAFLVYREYLRRKLQERLRGVEATTPEELISQTQQAFSSFMPTWLAMAGPAVYQSYLSGVAETAFDLDNPFLRELADNYAYALGMHLNETSADAIARGYAAQVNRKIAPKSAIANVVDAFGVTNRTMRSLTVMLSGKEDAKLSETLLPSVKKMRAKKVVAAAISDRATLVGEQEAWSAREQGKQVTWLYAQRQGIIPLNATRVWETADDEKVCPSCGPLNEVEIPISERFNSAAGKVWSPPVHPRCRCTVRLKSGIVREVAGALYNAKFQRQWLEADDVSKSAAMAAAPSPQDDPSDNDWMTQPRAKDGRFGTREAERPRQGPPAIQAKVGPIGIQTGALRPIIRAQVAPPAIKAHSAPPMIRAQVAPPAVKAEPVQQKVAAPPTIVAAPPAVQAAPAAPKVEEKVEEVPVEEEAVAPPTVQEQIAEEAPPEVKVEPKVEMDLFRLERPVYGIVTSAEFYAADEIELEESYFTDDPNEVRSMADDWIMNEMESYVDYMTESETKRTLFKQDQGLEFYLDSQSMSAGFEYLMHERNYRLQELYGDDDSMFSSPYGQTVRVDVRDMATGAWGTQDIALEEMVRTAALDEAFDEMMPTIIKTQVVDLNRVSDEYGSPDGKHSFITWGRHEGTSTEPLADQWGYMPYDVIDAEPVDEPDDDEGYHVVYTPPE